MTKDCPVGWRALKQRTAKVVVATFSIVAGFFGGIAAVRATESAISGMPFGEVPALESNEPPKQLVPIIGEAEDFTAVDGRVDLTEFRRLKAISDNLTQDAMLGRAEIVEKSGKQKDRRAVR